MNTILKVKTTLIFSTVILLTTFINVNAQETGQWDVLNEGIEGWPEDIKFVDENIGWISGVNTLLKTEDGGETWIAIPLDENWHFRKFDFLNESVGWAAGLYLNEIEDTWKYTIIKSIDGGQSWTIQIEFTEISLDALHVVDDSTVYAVGNSRIDDVNNALILKTSNGGTNWIDISPDLTDKTLETVWFVDTEVGVITGKYHDDNTESDKGLILKTVDGGITWDENIISEFVYIKNLQFINNSTGYFLAANDESQYFLFTTDTFNTWTIKTQSAYIIRSFFVFEDQTIFAVMDDSLSTNVMKSMDGGQSWEQKKSMHYILLPYKIYFNNAQTGLMMSSVPGPGPFGWFSPQIAFWKSIDGGKNWYINKFNLTLHDVTFVNHATGFVCYGISGGGHGEQTGMLLTTKDGGNNWNVIPDIGDKYINICVFINDYNGFFLEFNGRIFKTANGGESWYKVFENNFDSLGYIFGASDLSFLNEKIGWTVGSTWRPYNDSSGAGILETINDGENWDLIWEYPDTEEYNYSLKSIHVANSTAWAVGESGLIVKYTEQDQWQPTIGVTDLPLNKVFFSDENHGWIAGGYFDEDNEYLILLKTTDGGQNWQDIPDFNYQISDMFFEDSLHGWAVGNDTSYSGIILETEDGGDSWNVQVEGLSGELNAIHFKDGNGWAVGENGLVLRYDGVSWVDQKTGKTYPNKYSLSQNYPNPFNPSTKIKFTLPKKEFVTLEVFNTIGQKIETLLNQVMKTGQHEVEFDAQNLSSGIYYYRIEAGEFQDVKKMVLLR